METMTAVSSHPRVEEPVESRAIPDLLYVAALLARLGPEARAAAGEAAAEIDAGAGRTCIDAGGRLMLSLLGTEGRSFRVLTRCGTDSQGAMRWRRTYFAPGKAPERWVSEAYPGHTSAAWERALNLAKATRSTDDLRQAHSVLGARSRIYSVSWRLGGSQSAVSWKLDRGFPPEEALTVLGMRDTWPGVLQVWQQLLGFAPGPRSGPWSILLPLGGVERRVRIGSTNWALQPEDSEKRRRLVRLIDRMGGDGRFAEALYKLMEVAVPPACRRAIGRAIEVDIVGGQVAEAEFYLSGANYL